MEKDFCFKCGTILIFSEDSDKIYSSDCTKCGQGYAKQKGETLIESREDSSFTLPLYSIIFEKERVSDERITQIASTFLEQYDKRWVKIFIEDIDEEINNPKRKLVELLNLNGTEKIARDYLNRLSKEIKHRLPSATEENLN